MAVTQLCNAMASPNHDQHLSTNSQFICCQYESYVIVHQCPSFSCLFHCIPISKTLFSQLELFSPRESRQPWETSEHGMHLSLPTASLVAPATEYRRRLVRSSGVAWMWVAQESCASGKSSFQRLFASIIAVGAFNHKQPAQI